MLEKIEQYQKLLPHILLLANKAIQHRHWRKLFEAVGQPYEEDSLFTLTQLRQYGILGRTWDLEDWHLVPTLIVEISTLATGEYELESSLQNIEQFWGKASFDLVPYHNKTKNMHILAGVDEIKHYLEDHEITLTNMLNSVYVAGIQKVKKQIFNPLRWFFGLRPKNQRNGSKICLCKQFFQVSLKDFVDNEFPTQTFA